MSDNLLRRLEKLTAIYNRTSCETCHGVPRMRIVTLHEDGSFEGETIPAYCPECGAEVASTLELVGFTLDELP